MMIAQAPSPALTCVAGVPGKGGNGEDVVVLIAIIIGRGVKPNNQ